MASWVEGLAIRLSGRCWTFAGELPYLRSMTLPIPHACLGIHGVWADCIHCHLSVRLDLRAPMDAGLGDTLLIELPLRCSTCGTQSKMKQ